MIAGTFYINKYFLSIIKYQNQYKTIRKAHFFPKIINSMHVENLFHALFCKAASLLLSATSVCKHRPMTGSDSLSLFTAVLFPHGCAGLRRTCLRTRRGPSRRICISPIVHNEPALFAQNCVPFLARQGHCKASAHQKKFSIQHRRRRVKRIHFYLHKGVVS